MDRWEALYNFWASFGVPAYRASAVPDLKYVTFPYITYEAAVGDIDDVLTLRGNVWDENYSSERVDAISDEILQFIKTNPWHKYNGGQFRVWSGNTMPVQDMGDPDNDKIRRDVITLNFEFINL